MNIFNQFISLNDDSPKLIATVNSTDTGKIVVQYLGGATAVIQTNDSYTAGQRLFIKRGRIIGIVPNLTYFTVNV